MLRLLPRLLLLGLLGATPALAAPPASTARATTPSTDGLTVGVFLPTTLADGQQRFDFGEKLAQALGTALGQKATARNFARYADFMEALSGGKLDVAVVDAWIAAESAEAMPPAALATLGGASKRRWAVVAKPGRTMASLNGKTIAVTRGAGSADLGFLTNALFEGALQADKAWKPSFTPSVESAIKMWSTGNADAVVVPLPLAPTEGKVLYQSAPLPTAVVLASKARQEAVRKTLPTLSAIAPFEGFSTSGTDELATLRRLIASGPAAKAPVWAELPPLPLDAKAQVTWKGLDPVLPSVLELVNLSRELPDE